MRRLRLRSSALIALVSALCTGVAQEADVGARRASALWGQEGEAWTPTSRLPDFSHAGYGSGDRPIPDVPVACDVRHHGARPDDGVDDTAGIRAAIEACERGAVHLPAGRYLISDFIVIDKPGVVVRGDGPDRTILQMTRGIRELIEERDLKKITHTPQSWPAWGYQRWSNGFLNVVGLESTDPPVHGTRDAPWPIPDGAEVRWFEPIAPGLLHPQNLHLAQRAARHAAAAKEE